MRTAEEIYRDYVAWALRIGVPPMSRPEYEKALNRLPAPTENKIDAILRNNHPKKDR